MKTILALICCWLGLASFASAADLLPPIPADHVRTCLADAQAFEAKHGAGRANGFRYLVISATDKELASDQRIAAVWTLNAVSRTRAISQPVALTGHADILRFRLAQYATRQSDLEEWAATWDKLSGVDPYFHLTAEVINPATEKVEVKTVPGGWTDLAAHEKLAELTGSQAPVLRADTFVAAATAPPFYYDFTGTPKTRDEFLNSLGIDPKTIDRLRANTAANLIQSKITHKPRRILFSQGPLGGYYETQDVGRVEARKDPVRIPIDSGKLVYEYDASEIFAMGPNGMWRVALYDAKGQRQDAVPDVIAKDDSDPHADGRVIPIVSCMRCHIEGGLRPFTDDQRPLLTGKVTLKSYDPNIAQRALELYDEPRLKRQMDFDRDTYGMALRRALHGHDAIEAGDFGPADLAASLAACVRAYSYDEVTPALAAQEAGFSGVADMTRRLIGSRDPILLRLTQNGGNVLRDQFGTSFQEAALVAAGARAGGPVAKPRDELDGADRHGEREDSADHAAGMD